MTKNSNLQPTKASGFTLIEVLIYSTLLAVLFGFTFLSINNMIASNNRLLSKNEVASNVEFVSRKLEWIFLQAGSVSVPAPNSSSTIELTVVTNSTSTNPAVFSVSGANLFLSTAGASSTPIINDKVFLTSFTVEHVSNSQTTSTIKITMTLESKDGRSPPITSKLTFTLPLTN